MVKGEETGWANHEAQRGQGGLDSFGEYKSAVITVRPAMQCAEVHTSST